MEPITSDTLKSFLKGKKIELQPTQKKMCLPILNRLAKKMSIGIKFKAIYVEDGIIIDGHHRYLASLVIGADLDRRPYPRTSATEVTDWESIVYTLEDWDTEAKINDLNQDDAENNNLDIQVIKNLMK